MINNRDLVASSSVDSIFSLSSDSKYTSGITHGAKGLVPYAYDPAVDDKDPPDEEDLLHDPDGKGGKLPGQGQSRHHWTATCPWCGCQRIPQLLLNVHRPFSGRK